MLETIHNNWQLLAGLLAINLVFLVAGIGWPRRARDIREHPQWPEVRVLVDRYITIALPDPNDAGAPAARHDAAGNGAADDPGFGFYNRPAPYAAPEADDAEWTTVPTRPDPPPAAGTPHSESDSASDGSAVDPNQIAFAFAEAAAHARNGERIADAPSAAAADEPTPVTFLEWFAARERHRLDADAVEHAVRPRR